MTIAIVIVAALAVVAYIVRSRKSSGKTGGDSDSGPQNPA